MPGSGNTNTWEIGSLHSIRKDKLKNKQYSIRSASIAAERQNKRYNEHPREESVSPVPYYTNSKDRKNPTDWQFHWTLKNN